MAKKSIKDNAEMNNNNSNLLFPPERKIIDAESAMKMAARVTDYNDSRSEARNFKCVEFNGVKFNGEDLSGIEAHYSKFVNCEFSECKFSRMEAYFAEFSNCTFTNCDLANSNFSFAKIADTVFFNCNMDRADFSFVQGNFSCTGCMMERVSANNARLLLLCSNCNAIGFEGNCSQLEIDISGSNFSRAEFNDSTLQGKFKNNTNLTDAELNRSDLSLLHIAYDCATHGMEREDSTDDEIDSALDKAIRELEEIVEEK